MQRQPGWGQGTALARKLRWLAQNRSPSELRAFLENDVFVTMLASTPPKMRFAVLRAAAQAIARLERHLVTAYVQPGQVRVGWDAERIAKLAASYQRRRGDYTKIAIDLHLTPGACKMAVRRLLPDIQVASTTVNTPRNA